MSEINLTPDERIQALARLGYNEREGAFLSLAALHSGFFFRRQYCQFIQKQVGGSAAALVEKLLQNRDATVVAGCHNAKVYHLSARRLYAAIGQENSRHRRMRPAMAIKSKLMCLDYVLDNPAHHYLVTEHEKVAYFTATLGFDVQDLPAKAFRSPKAQEASAHFFVEKYPVFVRNDPDEGQTGSFCFIDEGAITSARFEGFLQKHQPLFAKLTRFEVIYVAASEAPFVTAEKTFRYLFSRPGTVAVGHARSWDLGRLLQHFADRHLYETGRFESFDRARLLQLRNDREEFSGRFFDALYRRWKSGGEEALGGAIKHQGPLPDLSRARFSTYLLKHSYDIFGTYMEPDED